jgi:hypothetical protein
MRHFTTQGIASLPTKQYRKTALTLARPLTEEDYQERGGIVQTLEGPQSFEIGDFLCVGIASEEWPMSQETFKKGKEYFEDAEEPGFALYTTKGTKYAAFVSEQFMVGDGNEPFTSKEDGGYIVYNDDPSEAWIVDKAIFEGSYEEA